MKTLLAFLMFWPALLVAENIATREVTYRAGQVDSQGFLAYPDDGEPRPGVLVVHEWWGHNEYSRSRARDLAELGYTALAVDMYGEGKTAAHPKDAGAYASMVRNNQIEMTTRFTAAMKFLQSQDQTRNGPSAAIGYCFGGNVVLQMARNGLPGLVGVASFHGSLGIREPNPPAKVKARVLVCTGESDLFVKPDQIKVFQEKMRAAGADLKFINYPDAMHSFTNPEADKFAKEFGLPLGYNAKADKASWSELEDFLRGLFSPPKTGGGLE